MLYDMAGADGLMRAGLLALQAEADSQVQLYKAQISKMQLALERADQENSRVEHELRVALEAPGKLREAQAEKRAGASSLSTLRDRVRSMSLLSPSLEGQAAKRLQVRTAPLLSINRHMLTPLLASQVLDGEGRAACSRELWLQLAQGSVHMLQDAREKLKSSQHELAAIQKQRDDLARQLALIAEKISSGVIPDPADLAVPEHIAAAAEASASAPRVHLPLRPLSCSKPHRLRCHGQDESAPIYAGKGAS